MLCIFRHCVTPVSSGIKWECQYPSTHKTYRGVARRSASCWQCLHRLGHHCHVRSRFASQLGTSCSGTAPHVSGAEPRLPQPLPPEKWAPFLPRLLLQEAEPTPGESGSAGSGREAQAGSLARRQHLGVPRPCRARSQPCSCRAIAASSPRHRQPR